MFGDNQTNFRGAQNATRVAAHSQRHVNTARGILTLIDWSVQDYLSYLNVTKPMEEEATKSQWIMGGNSSDEKRMSNYVGRNVNCSGRATK